MLGLARANCMKILAMPKNTRHHRYALHIHGCPQGANPLNCAWGHNTCPEPGAGHSQCELDAGSSNWHIGIIAMVTYNSLLAMCCIKVSWSQLKIDKNYNAHIIGFVQLLNGCCTVNKCRQLGMALSADNHRRCCCWFVCRVVVVRVRDRSLLN